MKITTLPYKFQDAWADNATGSFITTPVPDTTVSPIRTSQQLGFPPGTADPSQSPPDIRDFNGVLNYMSLWLQRLQAGQIVPLDTTFQGWIGGYPQGAVVMSAAHAGLQYISTVDDNTNNPDSVLTGWTYYAVIPTASVVSASGNVTVPAFKWFADIQLWGAGGGSSGGAGSSGAGGGYSRRRVAVTPGASLVFVIGTGGTAGDSSTTAATAGGQSTCTGAFGAFGAGGGAAGNAGPGSGGNGAGGDINLVGQGGTDLDGTTLSAIGGNAAGGGGLGGTSASGPGSYLSPTVPGGGGGAAFNGGTPTFGQNGAAGMAIVTF